MIFDIDEDFEDTIFTYDRFNKGSHIQDIVITDNENRYQRI